MDSFNVTTTTGMSKPQQHSPLARLDSLTHSENAGNPYLNNPNMMSTGESAFSSITSKTAANVLIPKPHVTRRKNN